MPGSVIITFSSFAKNIISPSHLHTLVVGTYTPTLDTSYNNMSFSLFQLTSAKNILLVFTELWDGGGILSPIKPTARLFYRKYATSIVVRNVLNALALRYDSHGSAIERVFYFFYKTLMAAG